MATKSLTAEKRIVLGRKVKRLRREGVLPANIYGNGVESLAVQVKTDEFKKVFSQTGETGLVDLKVSGEGRPVLIHNIQRDPVSGLPLHIDFLQVDLKEKVAATVPVELVGDSPAQKEGGIVVQQMHEIEVEALPADLPEKIEVDVSGLLNINDAISVKDIKVDKARVEVKEDLERVIVNVAPPVKEEEVVTPPAEEAAPAEGETPPGTPSEEQTEEEKTKEE